MCKESCTRNYSFLRPEVPFSQLIIKSCFSKGDFCKFNKILFLGELIRCIETTNLISDSDKPSKTPRIASKNVQLFDVNILKLQVINYGSNWQVARLPPLIIH